MQQVTNLAILRAKSDQAEELGKTLMALVEPSRREAGCLAYDVHRSNDDEATWMIYETWESSAHVNQHFHAPHMEGLARTLLPLLRDKADLHSFSRVSGSDWPSKA